MSENKQDVEVTEQEKSQEKTTKDYRLAKYKYTLQQHSNEKEVNGAYRTESEILTIDVQNMSLEDATEDIKGLINQGYEVEVSLKLKVPK